MFFSNILVELRLLWPSVLEKGSAVKRERLVLIGHQPLPWTTPSCSLGFSMAMKSYDIFFLELSTYSPIRIYADMEDHGTRWKIWAQ